MAIDAWPLILQHVREIAESHVAPPERAQLKIITPFPPDGPDFPDFAPESLEFLDRPEDADAASLDTIRAFEFARRVDPLYYDYSYGIRSEEYRLSDVCSRFFQNAKPAEQADAAFRAAFTEVGDAFLRRYKRSTAGDLGHVDFRYTAPTVVSWGADPFSVSGAEVARLIGKATQVYEAVGAEASPLVAPILAGLAALRLSSFTYELGMFDIVRPWFDPRLLPHPAWAFADGSRTLYGENDPIFADGTVRLAYALRIYVVRRARSTPLPPEQPTPPVVRGEAVREMLHVNEAVLAAVARRKTRDTLLTRRLTRSAQLRGTFATAVFTSGASPAPTTPPPPPPAEGWMVAAIRCRVLG